MTTSLIYWLLTSHLEYMTVYCVVKCILCDIVPVLMWCDDVATHRHPPYTPRKKTKMVAKHPPSAHHIFKLSMICFDALPEFNHPFLIGNHPAMAVTSTCLTPTHHSFFGYCLSQDAGSPPPTYRKKLEENYFGITQSITSMIEATWVFILRGGGATIL